MWSGRSGSYTRFTGSLHDIVASAIRALSSTLSYLQHNLEKKPQQPQRAWYCWSTMSALNGDKARFNRERKSKLARRERSQALRKKLKGYTLPRATGTQL